MEEHSDAISAIIQPSIHVGPACVRFGDYLAHYEHLENPCTV